ncbi:hypothetical protein CFN58_32170, partial [Pseudomonas avellanae]
PLLRASFSLASRRPPCVSLQLSSLSLATAFKWLVSAHAGHTGSGLVREKAGIIAENASYEIPSS